MFINLDVPDGKIQGFRNVSEAWKFEVRMMMFGNHWSSFLSLFLEYITIRIIIKGLQLLYKEINIIIFGYLLN